MKQDSRYGKLSSYLPIQEIFQGQIILKIKWKFFKVKLSQKSHQISLKSAIHTQADKYDHNTHFIFCGKVKKKTTIFIILQNNITAVKKTIWSSHGHNPIPTCSAFGLYPCLFCFSTSYNCLNVFFIFENYEKINRLQVIIIE